MYPVGHHKKDLQSVAVFAFYLIFDRVSCVYGRQFVHDAILDIPNLDKNFRTLNLSIIFKDIHSNVAVYKV